MNRGLLGAARSIGHGSGVAGTVLRQKLIKLKEECFIESDILLFEMVAMFHCRRHFGEGAR